MDIEFFRPIRISLDVVETDERLPSVKFKFEVESNAFSESFLYRGEVWIACKDLDIFNYSLGRTSCHLTSLDGLFSLEIVQGSGRYVLRWFRRKESVFGAVAEMKYESSLDSDDISAIKSSFDSFAKWW